MNKKQLRRTIFGVLRALLLANSRNVPHHNSRVRSRTRQNGFKVRRPTNVHHLVRMSCKRMQHLLQIAKIPQADSLVGTGCGNQKFTIRIERQRIDFSSRSVDLINWRSGVMTSIPNHKLREKMRGGGGRGEKKCSVFSSSTFLSSPTLPNKHSWCLCQSTSSTTSEWP